VDEVKKTGTNEGVAEFHKLKREAKALGIDVTGMKKDDLVKAINFAPTGSGGTVEITEFERLKTEAFKLGLDVDGLDKEDVINTIQRKQIQDTERIRIEVREKLMQEYRLKQDRADIIAESESLGILVTLPEVCTELDLAKARRDLGMKKLIPKPSPETLAIEASKKNYYIFRNLEQADVDISCNVGGKYRFDFIPDQLHCLPEYIFHFMRQRAVVPVYKRVKHEATKEGDFGETTVQDGVRPRFTFELIAEAPQETPFGVVYDKSLKDRLMKKVAV